MSYMSCTREILFCLHCPSSRSIYTEDIPALMVAMQRLLNALHDARKAMQPAACMSKTPATPCKRHLHRHRCRPPQLPSLHFIRSLVLDYPTAGAGASGATPPVAVGASMGGAGAGPAGTGTGAGPIAATGALGATPPVATGAPGAGAGAGGGTGSGTGAVGGGLAPGEVGSGGTAATWRCRKGLGGTPTGARNSRSSAVALPSRSKVFSASVILHGWGCMRR